MVYIGVYIGVDGKEHGNYYILGLYALGWRLKQAVRDCRAFTRGACGVPGLFEGW